MAKYTEIILQKADGTCYGRIVNEAWVSILLQIPTPQAVIIDQGYPFVRRADSNVYLERIALSPPVDPDCGT